MITNNNSVNTLMITLATLVGGQGLAEPIDQTEQIAPVNVEPEDLRRLIMERVYKDKVRDYFSHINSPEDLRRLVIGLGTSQQDDSNTTCTDHNIELNIRGKESEKGITEKVESIGYTHCGKTWGVLSYTLIFYNMPTQDGTRTSMKYIFEEEFTANSTKQKIAMCNIHHPLCNHFDFQPVPAEYHGKKMRDLQNSARADTYRALQQYKPHRIQHRGGIIGGK